jgi:hypothetical protein
MKRALFVLAMAGIYIWIRRLQQVAPQKKSDHAAESEWANEGGANPAPSV